MYIGTVKNVVADFYGATVVRKVETNTNDINDMKVDESIPSSASIPSTASTSNTNTNDATYFIERIHGEINHGLHRIFVEILSNAIDNVWRSLAGPNKASKIRVDITEEGRITIWNDGETIPVEVHAESGLYNPDLIFGRLLTSSNYDDDEARMTSGRNGLGGKVTNVFSKSFEVRLYDPESGYQYLQSWSDNMSVKSEPKLTRPKLKHGYTEISFLPDYARFGVPALSDDMRKLFLKNVLDTAMITGIAVYYNGERVAMKGGMRDYAMLYRPVDEREDGRKELIHLETADSMVVLCSQPRSEFSHISFVNGIETYHGGVHVDAWAEALLRPVLERVNAKVKKGGSLLTMKDIRPYFRLFLNCKLVNPTFTSQEKSQLGSPAVVDPSSAVEAKHINAVMRWEVVEEIGELLKSRELSAIKKTENKKRGFVRIPGLDSANLAGGKQFHECTLILCEGDSAKTFAVKGIQTGVGGKKGRDYFGIYPLRGKLLNVRNSAVSSITANKEICGVIRALNLRYDADYRQDDAFASLSYGRVMILTDSDVDGYHICGLLLNFFHKLFPTLLQRDPAFVTCMRTPIVRVYLSSSSLSSSSSKSSKSSSSSNSDVSFYTLEDYHTWAQSHSAQLARAEVKYFKGLGTNNNKEIESAFGKKMIEFVKDDGADQKMDQVFHTSFADYRKQWLADYKPSAEREIVSKDPVQALPISDFLDLEMIKFSIDDCRRSIASVMDGLKESQRKILYATFLKNLRYAGKTMKVAQLAGFVAEKTNYHHGEQCLFETITKMAHDFTGSNNIPLLYRDGQFGTRLLGGEDAASARYIFTKLDAYTRLLFRSEDDALLSYIQDEGDSIEPTFYVPIVPMVLVNGTQGIGTGWSSKVPNFHPLHIVEWIRVWLDAQEGLVRPYPVLAPWYRGFTGEMEKVSDLKYVTKGVLTQTVGRTGIVRTLITELPIGTWTDPYKDHLEDLMEQRKLKALKNNSTDVAVHLEVEEFKEEDAMKCNHLTLGLTSTLSLNNMVLFNAEGQLKRYASVEEILLEFCTVRFVYYERRKKEMLRAWEHLLQIAENKMRFLQEVMSGELRIQDRDEDDLLAELHRRGYRSSSVDKTEKAHEEEGKFQYLLGMHVRSFTTQRLQELAGEIDRLTRQIAELNATTHAQMWRLDLDEFVKMYSM